MYKRHGHFLEPVDVNFKEKTNPSITNYTKHGLDFEKQLAFVI